MTDKIKTIKLKTATGIKIIISLFIITAVSFSQYTKEENFSSENISNKFKLKNSTINKQSDDDGKSVFKKYNHQFSLSLGGAYLLPIGDLTGDLSTVSLTNGATSAPAYFEKYGYSFGLNAKMKVDKKNKFRATVSFSVNNFRNSGSDSSGTFTIEPELKYIQFGLGGEYSFAQFNQVIPYISVELNANTFYGAINFIDDSTGYSYAANYNRVTRYGVTVGAGADYFISNSWGLFLSVRYSVTNLLGKNFDATGLHDLNDESYTINGVSIKQKTISHLSVFAGFSVFIGD